MDRIVICTNARSRIPLLCPGRAVRPQLTSVRYQLPHKLGKAYNLALKLDNLSPGDCVETNSIFKIFHHIKSLDLYIEH
jgi:hypothetical protein